MSERQPAPSPDQPSPSPNRPSPDRPGPGRVYLFGGSDDAASAETFNGQEWQATALSQPTARRGHLGLVLRGKLYALGGRKTDSDTDLLRTMECYDPLLDRWEAKASLPIEFACLTGAALHGCLYVVLSDQELHNSLFVYDPDADEWQKRGAPRFKRTEAKLAALGGRLYLVGGHNDDFSLRKAEQYELAHDEWRPAARLRLARHDFALTTFRECLYAIGGTNFDPDSELALETVERYDPKHGKWRFVGDLQTARSGASAFVYDHGLYVAGGSPDFSATSLQTVERFDEASGQWSESRPLTEQRWEACCGVLSEKSRPVKRQRVAEP